MVHEMLLNMSLDEVKAFASSCSKEEMANALAIALQDAENIRAPEYRDCNIRYDDPILHQPFDI